jgi:FKBP-type peptidyl-prolyl cis-trans isomerase SlyD
MGSGTAGDGKRTPARRRESAPELRITPLKCGTTLLRDMTDEEAETAETDEADSEEEQTPDESEGLGDGDFVELAYTARTIEDGTLVDTTDPEVAEEEGVDEQDQEFKPRTIVIGEGHIFESVEDALRGGAVGDEGSVTVDAGEAFGEYDPDQVRTVSADKIEEDDRYPGAPVTIDGEEGHVETIIGGRARVDFNHPLAGEDIEYEYEVVDVIEDREERAKGLFDMYIGQELDVWFETNTVEEEQMVEPDEDEGDEENDGEPSEPEFETVEVEKDTLYVEATPQLSMNQQWLFSKQQIAQDLVDKLGVDRVIVQEELGGGMGMPGMMGGMGGAGGEAVEEALEDADVDAEDIAAELGEE